MSKFWMVTEDPFYDEDVILIDEDAEWEDSEVPSFDESFDPHETINS